MLQKERAALETAIKSLELSLHPNTSDQEVLAGILGFRVKAKGRPLSEIAHSLYGGQYDGRTLPEYREEWETKFDRQNAEMHNLTVQVRELNRQKNQLQILLAKEVAERQQAVNAKLKAETKMDEARQVERAAMAHAKSTAKAAARVAVSPARKERPVRESVVDVTFLKKTDARPKKPRGASWPQDQYDYLVSLYQEDPTYPNKYLRDRMNAQFGTTRTENSMRGVLTRLRDKGVLDKYRPGHERKAAA